MKALANKGILFIIYFSFFLSCYRCFSQDIFYCENADSPNNNDTILISTCNYFYNFYTESRDSLLQYDATGVKQSVKIIAIKKNKVMNGPICYYVGDTVLFMKGYMKNGKADSSFVGFSLQDDHKKRQCYRTAFKNGNKEGEEVEYYHNGSIKYIRNYKEGQLDGMFKYLDMRGDTFSLGYYRNGKKINEWLEADPPHRIAVYQNWNNGKLTGYIWTSYFANRKMFICGSYDSKDRKQGLFMIYDQDGELSSTENYRNGKLSGYITTYYKGEPTQKIRYKNNRIVGRKKKSDR